MIVTVGGRRWMRSGRRLCRRQAAVARSTAAAVVLGWDTQTKVVHACVRFGGIRIRATIGSVAQRE